MEILKKIDIVNKKAKHEYEFLFTIDAGIVLLGTEIKSIRLGHINLNEAYCLIIDGQLYLDKLHISEYSYGTYNNHVPKRRRKLLVKSVELKKLHAKVKEKGFAIIPYRIFINERGYAKVEIALARGKKEYDKRETLKAKDQRRELDRSSKYD